MNKLIIILTILLATGSCRSEVKNVKNQEKPVNFMVLLDLSDRLTIPGQAERDIEIIKTVYSEFNRKVRQNLIINSKDKFQLIIAPQKGVPYNPEEFENSLFLDMGSLNSGIKANTLIEFENSLSEILQNLYSKAFLGDKISNYPGTGIWQFFNENLEYLAGNNYVNNLIIITDGYFDFEDYTKQLPEGKRFPTTSFLTSVRNKPEWKMILEKNDIGLLPIKKEFPALQVFVTEINAKYDFQYESDMLVYVWEKWCMEMKIPTTEVILKTSLPQTVNLLVTKLSNNQQ